ncbi:hypothetical protein [Kineosporia sp. NBRC 101731]|nr:hypothetical protein [Kineosporia sp. NBRC 101731]GLY28642.1 hypothetical protein Kisp02_20070 [Kineosporia sp. NBRC 101731]
MTFLIVFLLLATVALAPWLGADSRSLDPNRLELTHPLHRDSGMNVG